MPVRKQCSAEAPTWSHRSLGSNIELKLKVVTPMFGGGYEARNVDEVCPIRAAAIRGQLRFWWRATAGAKYATAKELYEAEEALWGGAARYVERDGKEETIGCGRVASTVRVTNKGEAVKCGTYNRRNDRNGYKSLPDFQGNWPPYALQPFQGKASRDSIEEEPATALLNAEFALALVLADGTNEAEVRQALAAWIKFGGLGARTRRGCGSLSCAAGPDLERLSPAGFEDLTALSDSVAVWGSKVNDPLLAWSTAVNVYRDFRQKAGFARNPGQQNRPGRSRWPEADAIRRLQRRNAHNHAPTHALLCGFPRADLGLPIIFHFKDQGDPPDATLQGPSDGLSRFASPVITKAVAVQGGYKPLVLVLNSPHAWQFGALRLDGQTVTQAQIQLSAAERGQVPPLDGQEVREALIHYVEQQWQTKREVLK